MREVLNAILYLDRTGGQWRASFVVTLSAAKGLSIDTADNPPHICYTDASEGKDTSKGETM